LATLLLAAGLPVTVAASAPSWIPAAMGALIAVIEGAQQLFKFQENWINYRSSCENLRREQYLYLARAGHYAGATDAVALLAESVERILGQETSHWAERETA
jgi:diacylglycerol kinase family enzyme